MKTLDEHNKQVFAVFTQQETYPMKNGIECPKCKQELYDKDNIILASNPPKRNIVCLNKECNYTGHRY